MKPILFLLAPLGLATAWQGYGMYLQSQIPSVRLEQTTSMPVSNERTLPFYELMSPLPPIQGNQLIPRLEYKKGPPDRFIEQISLLVQSGKREPKERVVFHGRRTQEDFIGLDFFPKGPNREAAYLETALRLSQGEPSPLGTLKEFLLRPFFLRKAAQWIGTGVESIQIMDQAGAPAFFFSGLPRADGRIKSTALFIRRSSFYRIDYVGDRGFRVLQPETLFRKSFLIEKRSDALEYLAKNLSEVQMEQTKSTEFSSIAWPILLLAANVSVDPSSLEAYFHFAGISALLYRSLAMDASDMETLDILRNNVLASEFYAKDVGPSSPKTAQISRLARMLTRSFE